MARPKKITENKDASIVRPLVVVEGESHILKTLSEMPMLKSVGYVKLDGTNSWISYTITSQGKSVLSIEVGEPNLRAIAEESAKISFVEQFSDRGL